MLGQGPDRCAQPAGHILDAGHQGLLQPRALDADAGTDIAPERLEIALATGSRPTGRRNRQRRTRVPARSTAASRPRARSTRMPLAWTAIPPPSARHIVLRSTSSTVKALPAERTAEREPRDPTTDDQDCLDFGHVYSGIPTTTRSCPNSVTSTINWRRALSGTTKSLVGRARFDPTCVVSFAALHPGRKPLSERAVECPLRA